MMKTLRTYPFALSLLLTLLLAMPLVAQEGQPSPEEAAMMEAMMKAATPGGPHAYLAEMAGTWKATMKMWDPSGQESQAVGTMERSMTLDGRVLEENFKMDFMGMPFVGVGHTGYDNVTGKYWTTWYDNMSTGVTLMEGAIDEKTGKGSFKGEGPEPSAGKKIPMRMDVQREGDNKETATFFSQTPNGEMAKTMEIVYERQ